MVLNDQPAYDTSSTQTPGVLTRLTLPTLGSVGWTYAYDSLSGPVPNPRRSPAIDHPVVVATRAKYDALGNPVVNDGVHSNNWTYTRVHGDRATCQVTCENGDPNCHSGRDRQLTVVVTEPWSGGDSKTAISYFSFYEYLADPNGDTCSTQPQGWVHAEHGLPFTRNVTRASTAGDPVASRFLSSELRTNFDSSVLTNWIGGAGRVPGSGTVLRETYVTYVLDCNGAADLDGFDHDAALSSTATYFVDDTSCNGTCYTATNDFAPDGYGHFRQASTFGNFPGTANFRTTFTNYNPSFPPPSCPPAAPPATWLLNTYSEQCVADEISPRSETLTGCASLPSAFTVKTQFDSHGALTAKRTLKQTNGALDSADLLATIVYDAGGNVVSEQYAGGEAQPIDATNAFPSVTPTYAITHSLTYKDSNGAACTNPLGCALTHDLTTYSNGVVVSDVEFNRATLLPSSTRDLSGLQTTYDYDALGRITSVQPPGLAPTNYSYPIASTAGGFSPAKVLATTDASAYGIGQVKKEYQYDAFGRLWRQKALLDDDSWSIVQNDYDALGRHIATSTPEKLLVSESSFSPAHKTRFTLDALDRPTIIQAPDQTTTTMFYVGTRQSSRTIGVATGSSNCDTATTTETHDALGRLVQVVEPSGTTSAAFPCGTYTTTTYTYNAHDQLTSVNTGAQWRQFLYDGRGLLSAEQHPELGRNGNGSANYVYDPQPGVHLGYDARGHARARLTGAIELRFSYDAAERLTDITDNGDALRAVKHFDFYPTTTAAGTRSRIQNAIRYNRPPSVAGDVVVKESYSYDGTTGRASHRDTLVENVNNGTHATLQTFAQDFHYDQLGASSQIDYPSCPSGACAGETSTVIPHTRTNGYLKAVGTYASQLTYNPDGTLFEVSQSAGVKDTYTPDPTGMSRPYTISVTGTQSCTGPTATVSGGGTIEPGGSIAILAFLTGTPPWNVTWSDGTTDMNVGASPLTHAVHPATTTTYTVTSVTDRTGCPGSSSGSATVTVALSTPTGLVATTQTNALQVFVQWNSVSGAGWYQLQRATRIDLADWQNIGGHLTATSYTDTFGTASTPAAYLYRVIAGATVNGTETLSPPSVLDYATVASTLFTDDPLAAGSTRVKGQHVAELRRAIDAVRAAAALVPAWTSYAPPTGRVNASDNVSMRTALDQAASVLIGHNISYSDMPASNTKIRDYQFGQIRGGVR